MGNSGYQIGQEKATCPSDSSFTLMIVRVASDLYEKNPLINFYNFIIYEAEIFGILNR